MLVKAKKVRLRLLESLLALLLLLVVLFLAVPQADAAENSGEKTELTEQMAREFAQEFALSQNEDKPILVSSVVKFYDEYGQAVGYSIDYCLESGERAGYVVFDSECPGLIAEYSFESGSMSPLTRLSQVQTLSRNSASLKPLRMSPFVYAVEDVDSHVAVDMYGNVEDAHDGEDFGSSAPITPDWDMIFFDNTGSFQYNIVSSNHFQEFMSFEESWVESQTGRYACGVSALINLAAVNDLADTFNWNNWGAEYIALWNATNAQTSYVKDGITYGYNYDSDIGSGYVSYCASRGKTLGCSLSKSPAYSQFTSSVDNGRSSVFAARLQTSASGTIEGHYMAVQGYAKLQKTNVASDYLYSLIVSDGRCNYARYLNFYYAGYYNTVGIFFS